MPFLLMQHYRAVLFIGVIEIGIGGSTLISNLISSALSQNDKSLTVLSFVLVAGMVSAFLGIGLLKCRKEAYLLLLYFSSVIILSKVLILLDVIHLNGALVTAVPEFIHNAVSITYHGFIIYYLNKPDIKAIFHR